MPKAKGESLGKLTNRRKNDDSTDWVQEYGGPFQKGEYCLKKNYRKKQTKLKVIVESLKFAIKQFHILFMESEKIKIY